MEMHKTAVKAGEAASLLWDNKGGAWASIEAQVPMDTAADMICAMRGATGKEPTKAKPFTSRDGEGTVMVSIDCDLPVANRDRAVRSIAYCASFNGGWVC